MARATRGGVCYHVINRGNGGMAVFRDDGDFRAFVDLTAAACERLPLDVLAWCLMPNHFHFVLRPHHDGDLSRWVQWLTTTHVRRYHRVHGSSGHLWQGRFKAFPIQEDDHLLAVLRYVERNPLRAGLVERAGDWAWSSLCRRQPQADRGFLGVSPVPLPADWATVVDEAPGEPEVRRLQHSLTRGTPFGEEGWMQKTAAALGIEASLRPRGRPRKHPPPGDGQGAAA